MLEKLIHITAPCWLLFWWHVFYKKKRLFKCLLIVIEWEGGGQNLNREDMKPHPSPPLPVEPPLQIALVIIQKMQSTSLVAILQH